MMAQLELVHPEALELDRPVGRVDHEVIAQLVSDGARVLDVGCGDGALMRLLMRECNARARGLELDPAKVHGCVSRGLSVVQGDAERDLDHFPSAAFEYVIFSQSLLRLRRPLTALKAAARVGERVIVSFDNAAHWKRRLELMFGGRFARWDDVAATSVRDFAQAARELRLTLERAVPVSRGHQGAPFQRVIWRANWFAEQAVFLISS